MAIKQEVLTNILNPEAVKVLRNTYTLLSITLLFSAIMCGVAMAINAPFMGLWMLIPYIGCLWMVEKNKNRSAGLFWLYSWSYDFLLFSQLWFSNYINSSRWYSFNFLCMLILRLGYKKRIVLYERISYDGAHYCFHSCNS